MAVENRHSGLRVFLTDEMLGGEKLIRPKPETGIANLYIMHKDPNN